MNILSINNLAKIGREKPLFTNVTFGIQEGEKAALIGKNGSGKSTLLNTIAGILPADEGSIVINKEAGVSFLPQNPSYNPEDTIRQHIFKYDSPKLAIIKEYLEECQKLSNQENLDKNQKRYEELLFQMENKNLWNYESQISSILTTLKITNLEEKMANLSGGMIKKVALAQVLVEDTKLLLLDEPTNHLDISTIKWLQDYLASTSRSVLMVTHDRYFLDAVCNNIYELARNKLKLYVGNYSSYLEKKATEAEIEANTERRIESVLRFEREWLLRGPCARGTKIKARIQRDLQLINREKFQQDKGFTFEVKGKRLGGKVLELHNISKNFKKGLKEENPVIKNFSYVFTKGQKIGIFGDNGSGKTTLLNIITQNLPADTGSIDVGVNTRFAYYTQNPQFKDTNLTVLEYIKESAEHITRNDGKSLSASKFLEEFGFEGKIQYSPVSSLSGGEKKRLYLVRLLLQNPNFLILDEPTNDFDIFTMNILEDFLMQYQGCLLLVSHDRYFMDKCVDSLFVLEDEGYISGFVGKCSEYIEYKAQQQKIKKGEVSPSLQKAKPSSATLSSGVKDSLEEPRNAPKDSTAPQKPKKLSFKEQREFDALDQEIPLLEAEQKELEEKMSSSDFAIVKEASERYKEITEELQVKMARWEELAI